MNSGKRSRDARRIRAGEASVTNGPRNLTRGFDAAPARVRIIGGLWKRTTLPVIDAPGLRPSPDRVRETVFNWLAHFIPDFAGATGLDLFAGTGALGFEFASRGAAGVTLVERNPALVAQLRRSRERLAADTVTVIAGDALGYAGSAPAQAYDVVFLDPPFDAGLLESALSAATRLVKDAGLIYAESGEPLAPDTVARCGLRLVREGRAGQVRFHLLQKA